MLRSHWLAVSTLSTVTRCNITMILGPNRLSFMVVTLPEPSWKDAFFSYFCAHAEYHHLLFRTAAPATVSYTNGLSPLPCQPGMTQFPLTLAWLISNQALHCISFFFFFFPEASWQLSRHGSVSQFPSHSTTAQL